VLELDHKNYQYALVCGPDRSYLWILARDPVIIKDTKDFLLAKAAAMGFETNKLIYVKHD
jgi:apolipoprotein D and lipocalin family protein